MWQSEGSNQTQDLCSMCLYLIDSLRLLCLREAAPAPCAAGDQIARSGMEKAQLLTLFCNKTIWHGESAQLRLSDCAGSELRRWCSALLTEEAGEDEFDHR